MSLLSYARMIALGIFQCELDEELRNMGKDRNHLNSFSGYICSVSDLWHSLPSGSYMFSLVSYSVAVK